jgi:hypothetical protein
VICGGVEGAIWVQNPSDVISSACVVERSPGREWEIVRVPNVLELSYHKAKDVIACVSKDVHVVLVQ